MPEVVLTGAAGRLEGRYAPGKTANAPIALILHPHPKAGGHMNNPVTVQLYHLFMKRGFATLRFNFRGVGKSQGEFDSGIGELADAASALDWLQAMNPQASQCWVAGYSFGAWISMQLLMRRPETDGFISVVAADQRLRLQLPGPLPGLRPDPARRRRHGGDAAGGRARGGQAAHPEGHPRSPTSWSITPPTSGRTTCRRWRAMSGPISTSGWPARRSEDRPSGHPDLQQRHPARPPRSSGWVSQAAESRRVEQDPGQLAADPDVGDRVQRLEAVERPALERGHRVAAAGLMENPRSADLAE